MMDNRAELDLEWITDEYGALVERAKAIVSGAPYWHYVHESDWAKITIDGDNATLWNPHVESEWDSWTVETESVTFPTRLLRLNDSEIAEWKATEDANYRQRERERQDASAAQARENAARAERETYERLKAKFETPRPQPL